MQDNKGICSKYNTIGRSNGILRRLIGPALCCPPGLDRITIIWVWAERMCRTMAPTTSTESRTVSGYFKELDIRPAKNSSRFWRKIEEQFGVDTRRRLDSIIEDRTDNDGRGDIYSAKNQNLALSVAFSRWSADLYRRYLEWFVTHIPRSPRAILDVGCDTCISLLWHSW